MKKRNRNLSVILALALAVTACADATDPGVGELPDLKHDPILFVHGYAGNGGNFEDMKARFKADGWQDFELYAYNYSFISSNATSGAEIRDQVDDIIKKTGATKVDIIAFSMGSISSRYYLKNFDGALKVDAWVSMGGPNHGTDAVENNNCQFTPCKEIIPGSAFLTALNSVDETPGPLVRYATWRSPCDQTINPDESVILAGATNNQTACIQHLEFLIDANVYQQVKVFIQ
jgi:triacylglycerol lipase